MRFTSGLLAAAALVAAVAPTHDHPRPDPEWYQQACSIIDGEDDPC
jgi:hypothetical protein